MILERRGKSSRDDAGGRRQPPAPRIKLRVIQNPGHDPTLLCRAGVGPKGLVDSRTAGSRCNSCLLDHATPRGYKNNRGGCNCCRFCCSPPGIIARAAHHYSVVGHAPQPTTHPRGRKPTTWDEKQRQKHFH